MSEKAVVSLDVMGGDHGAKVVLPAALRVLAKRSDLALILVGDEEIIRKELATLGADSNDDRITIKHASQRVEMDDLPSHALRTKKDSSMRVALNLVKEGQAQACVSAGNTGALMATARYVLKMLPGIDRPAICTSIPNMQGHTWMLDLGANINCTADHLFQFSLMGSVLAKSLDDNKSPRIGLLNIGEEEIKGNEVVKETAALLAASTLNSVGFVEGDDIYSGKVDVVVCDGFVGNISLKTSEGVAKMITYFLKREFSKNIFTKLAALVAMPVLKAFKNSVDPRRYNGASLLGLRATVIKSHGGADAFAFANAIEVAADVVNKNVPERISLELKSLMEQEQAV